MNSTQAPTGSTSIAAIVRSTFEAVFSGDTKVFDSHPGLAGLKKVFPSMLVAFADFSAELRQQMVDGDRVASHWIFRGTHRGDLYGIAPTGKAVQFQNLSIARVENGRIVDYNSEVGWLTVFRELGIIPFSSNPNSADHN